MMERKLITAKAKLLGPVKEVLHGHEISQAKGFKQYAIEVMYYKLALMLL